MKKFFAFFLAALVACGSLSLAFASPASAAELEPAALPPDYQVLDSGVYSGWYHLILGQTLWDITSVACIIPVSPFGDIVAVLGNEDFAEFRSAKPFHAVTSETCFFAGAFDLSADEFGFTGNLFPYETSFGSWGGWLDVYAFSEANNGFYVYFPPDTQISVDNSESYIRPVRDDEFADYEPMPGGFFGEIYTMISDAFYGSAQVTGYQDLVVTTLATSLIVFMFCIPFIVVAVIVFLLFKGVRL